ncbi:MAG: deoxyribose-phosphate aldolase [Clostridia bacterium]|nr:deoxyribose-phosphate aldolase [Clostridia bacterium]
MDIQAILSRVDHTLLRQDATREEILALCDEGLRYRCASVCIPPCFLEAARAHTEGRLTLCTVIGFPNGYMRTAAKCFEASDAVKAGADEIDMVIHVGALREGRYDDVRAEIAAVKAACEGRLLKVIIETCLLTDEEKAVMCRLVAEGGAEYIKTSTGFAGGGATAADVALLAKHRPRGLLIKAAGGISSLEDAERFIALGADRLGTSRIVRIVKEMEKEGTYRV